MNKISDWVINKEPYFFFLFSVLNLIVLFQLDFFYSLDTPQHLYVANTIAELFKGNDEIARFIQINNLVVGYWSGTFLLAIFKLLFPAKIAIKLLLIIYYLGIAYSFRYLIKSISNNPTLVTLLIIPFSATFFIGMGYLNFSLAIALMFLCLGYFIRKSNNFTWKSMLIMGLLLLLQFLTHAFVFAFTGLLLAIYVIFDFFIQWQQSGKAMSSLKVFFKQLGTLTLVSIPAVVLCINYIVSIQEITSYFEIQHNSMGMLVENIKNISILSWFVTEPHMLINKFILVLLALLGVYTIISRIISFKKGGYSFRASGLTKADFGLFATLIVAILYFFYPDRLFTGNISMRILLILFLTLLTWLSSQRYPAFVSVIVMIAIIPISIMKWEVHMRYLPQLSSQAVEVAEINRNMEENSVYVAVNYSNLWTQSHLTSMPGIDKPLIYAHAPQVQGQFPLMVNKEECPHIYIGTKNTYTSKIYWALLGNDTVPVRPADYAVLINKNAISDNPDQQIVLGEIRKYYVLIDSSSANIAQLYELRNRKQLLNEYRAATANAREEIRGTDISLSAFYREKYIKILNEICLADSTMIR